MLSWVELVLAFGPAPGPLQPVGPLAGASQMISSEEPFEAKQCTPLALTTAFWAKVVGSDSGRPGRRGAELLEGLSAMTEWNLNSMKLNDEDCNVLVHLLAANPQLKSLNLNSNNIGDEGASRLQSNRQCPIEATANRGSAQQEAVP